MATYEGRWDCDHCGTSNPGLQKVCSACGNPQDENEEFYLAQDARVITDAAELAAAEAGADWSCRHCGADNPARRNSCQQCGAERGSSPQRETRFYAGDVGIPRTAAEAERGRRPERLLEPLPANSLAPPKTKQLPGWLAIALVAALFLLGWALFRTRPVAFTVQGFSWERAVYLEREATVVREGWEVPSGGRKLSTSRRVHHHNQVVDRYENRTRTVSERRQTGTRTVREKTGTRDNGNGTFSDVYETRSEPVYETVHRQVTESVPVYRSVPVYATWYRYEIEEWNPSRQPRAGGRDQRPYWPDSRLQRREREARRSERYRLFLRDPKGKQYQYEPDLDAWQRCAPGMRLTGHVNAFGALRRLELP